MGYSTVYDVKVRYSVDNRAGRAVNGLASDTRKLAGETSRAAGLFGKLGVAVAGAFGARMAGKALIGFNSTVEDTKNQIAGMLALTRKTDLVDQLKNADRLFGNLQKRANTLPGTTMEYARMAGMLTQPVIDAGLQMKDLENITVNAVVGAKALGVEWETTARDIDQALRGSFRNNDVFTGKMLGSIGYKGEEGRTKFNAMSADKRAAELNRAMSQKQITQLAAAQGASFSGALSTLQDTFEQFAGKVGAPLFKVITNELKEWNKWIASNGHRLDEIGKTIGDGLVDGFRFVKDAIGFLVSHADTLIMIGKVWGAVKIGGMLGLGGSSAGGGIAGKAGGLAAWLKGGVADKHGWDLTTGERMHTPGSAAGRGRSAVGGIKGAAGQLPLLGQALGAGLALGMLIDDATGLGQSLSGAVKVNGKLYDVTDRVTRQFIALERSQSAYDENLRRAHEANPNGPRVINNLRGIGADHAMQANLVASAHAAWVKMQANPLDFGLAASHRDKKAAAEAAGIDFESIGNTQAFIDAQRAKAAEMTGRAGGTGLIGGTVLQVGIAQLTEYQRKTLDLEKANNDVMSYMARQIGKGEAFNPATVMEMLRGATSDPEGKHKNVADKAKVNITIQRIEVQSDDPDRMAFGLIESFRDAAKNPSSAVAAMREG